MNRSKNKKVLRIAEKMREKFPDLSKEDFLEKLEYYAVKKFGPQCATVVESDPELFWDEYSSNSQVHEAEGQITDFKPGQSATIKSNNGVTTTVDLKTNPTALTKDPSGKLKLVTNPQPNTTAVPQQPQTPKPGDKVELSTESVDRLLQLAGMWP